MDTDEIRFTPTRNRILDHWANHDTGTISAFCVFDWPAIIEDKCKNKNTLHAYMIPYEENMRNHRRLRYQLQFYGYGYIEIEGRYIDSTFGNVVDENSLFVFDKDDKGGLLETLQELAHIHFQDTITFAKKHSDYSLYSTTPFISYGAELRERILGDNGTIAKFNGSMSFLNDINELQSEESVYSRIRSRGFEFTNYKPVASRVQITDRLDGVSRGGTGVWASYHGVYYAENELKKLMRNGYIGPDDYSESIFAPECIGKIQSLYDVLVNHDFAIAPIDRDVLKRLQNIPYGYFESVAKYNKRRILLYVFVDIDDDKYLFDELDYRQIEYIEARKPFEYEKKKMDTTILKRICIDQNNRPDFYIVGNRFYSPTKH